MDRNAELKPCPFCGSEARLREYKMFTLVYAECFNRDCGARTKDFPVSATHAANELATTAWNRRIDKNTPESDALSICEELGKYAK